MTYTNLIDAAKADAQSAAILQAKVEALLAGHTAQTFTPPEPESQCSFCGWTDGEHASGCPYDFEHDTTYHPDTREISTEDLVGAHFVGPMAGR